MKPKKDHVVLRDITADRIASGFLTSRNKRRLDMKAKKKPAKGKNKSPLKC